MKKQVTLKGFCIFLIIILNFIFSTIVAFGMNIKNGQVVDEDKVWKVSFNKEINFNENVKNDIKVLDDKNNDVKVRVELGKDNKSIMINPPADKYKLGEKYTIIIGKNITSKESKKLNKKVSMDFYIKNYNKDSVINKLIVLPDKKYNKEEAEKMINRIKKIPYPILSGLKDKNVKIILSNTNITGVKEYEYLKGVVPRGWEGTGHTWDDVPGAGGNPVVARIGYSNPGNLHGSINLELHETAHAIDQCIFNNISSSQVYKDIWRKEVQTVFGNDPYFVNYPEEYFAETFAMYYLNKDQNLKLKQKAPLTYKFIESLSDRLEVAEFNFGYFFFSYFRINIELK